MDFDTTSVDTVATKFKMLKLLLNLERLNDMLWQPLSDG